MLSIQKFNRLCPILRRADQSQVAFLISFIGHSSVLFTGFCTLNQIRSLRGPKTWDNVAKGKRESNNMNRWLKMSALAILCALAAGCGKAANDQDAIRASIEKHLNARSDLNLSAMDREVKQVSVNGDHANAQVEFRVKGGDARMDIEYALERQGKEWAVTSSQPVGMGDAHSGADQPPAAGPDSKGGQLPQGHPAVN